MKKQFIIYLFLFSILQFVSSCRKEDTIEEIPVFEVAGKQSYTTASGLQYIPVVEGTGTSPVKYSEVAIQYNMYLNNSTLTKVASTSEIGQAVTFMVGVGDAIKGLDEGIRTMKPGGKARFILPDSLAFGDEAVYRVPANSSIVLDVILLAVNTDTKVVTEAETLNHYADSLGYTDKVTTSGMYIIETLEGTGDLIASTKTVSYYYTLMDLKGNVIDKNTDNSTPATFIPAQNYVIAGLIEAVSKLRKGSKARLLIPSYLAYGKSGYGTIKAYQTLILDINITNVAK